MVGLQSEMVVWKQRDCAAIRRSSFGKRIPYNEKLGEMSRDLQSHFFLVNAASQNTYLYQVEFVQAFSEQHFQKRLSELKILDWGCGKGHVSFLLKERGADVVSCDHYEAGATDDDSAFGQNTPIIQSAGIRVDMLKEAVRLPYSDRAFDVALSFGVLEHVQNDLESLKELRRVLRRDGLLFCFNLPYVLSWTQWVARRRGDFYHDRLYTESRTRELLKSAGYKLLDVWHRQLLPKNSVRYPFYGAFESLDQLLVRFTPLAYLATNIEFIALAERHKEAATAEQ